MTYDNSGNEGGGKYCMGPSRRERAPDHSNVECVNGWLERVGTTMLIRVRTATYS